MVNWDKNLGILGFLEYLVDQEGLVALEILDILMAH